MMLGVPLSRSCRPPKGGYAPPRTIRRQRTQQISCRSPFLQCKVTQLSSSSSSVHDASHLMAIGAKNYLHCAPSLLDTLNLNSECIICQNRVRTSYGLFYMQSFTFHGIKN